MAVSRLVEVTNDEINCFKETGYFSNNHLVIILKQLFTTPSANNCQMYERSPDTSEKAREICLCNATKRDSVLTHPAVFASSHAHMRSNNNLATGYPLGF